jgi:hypothetical protein
MTPMTSIALESAFSTGGRVLSNYWNWLKPAVVCQMCFKYQIA